MVVAWTKVCQEGFVQFEGGICCTLTSSSSFVPSRTDYYFRLEMHASLFNGMVDVLEEVWKKQESGKEQLLPLQTAGNYEVVHAAGQNFVYDGYQRNHNKASCNAGGSK